MTKGQGFSFLFFHFHFRSLAVHKVIKIFLKAIDNHSHLYIIENDSHYQYEIYLIKLKKL